MIALLHGIDTFFGNHYVLFVIHLIGFFLKSCLLYTLVRNFSKMLSGYWHLVFLSGVVLGSLISDCTWLIILIRILFIPNLDNRIGMFFVRIAWSFTPIQYQSMSFLVASLVKRDIRLSPIQIILCIIS